VQAFKKIKTEEDGEREGRGRGDGEKRKNFWLEERGEKDKLSLL